jgi:hypothetical protein
MRERQVPILGFEGKACKAEFDGILVASRLSWFGRLWFFLKPCLDFLAESCSLKAESLPFEILRIL